MTIGYLLVVWMLFIICPIALLIGLIALSEWATRISVEKRMKKYLKVDLRRSREWHIENGYPVACQP